MDESALKILLDNLETSRASLDWWLGFWTLLVVVGVVFEVAFVVWEYVDELHEFRRGEVHPPRKPSTAVFALELLGAGLVAIGVSGELYIEAKIGAVETEIRKTNDLRALLLSKEAGDAKTSADGAAAAASRANNAADEAQRTVSAVARRAERIGAELGQSQWLISARRILKPDELSAELSKHFKGRQIAVQSYIGDQEGHGLCTQLAYIAQKAEMNAVNMCGLGALTSSPMTSVVVSGPDPDETEEIGKDLVTVGRLSFGGTVSGVKGSMLTIFVGYKPAFIIGPTTIRETSKRKAKQ